MAVPKTKKELLQQSQQNYQQLMEYINHLTAVEQVADFPKGTMNRNIRDVLAHLYHWHLMFMDWYEVGTRGEKPNMPAKGFTWKETKALNFKIWQYYQHHELEDVKRDLNVTYHKLQQIIEKYSDEELFEKRRYKWTGSSSLATYLRSSTSSHYNWAYKLIKKAKANSPKAN